MLDDEWTDKGTNTYIHFDQNNHLGIIYKQESEAGTLEN